MKKNHKFKAVCFDWGNTIEIGDPGIVKTLQHVWKRFSANSTAEEILDAAQTAWRELVKIKPTRKDLLDMSGFRHRLYAKQAELMATALGVNPNVPDWPWVFNAFFHEYYFTNRSWKIPRSHARLLRKLRATNIPMIVVANDEDPAQMPTIISQLGLTGFFETDISSSSFGFSKPHPKIYLAACNRIDLRADEILFVGDDFHNDYWGPEQIGMYPLLYDPDDLHAKSENIRLLKNLEDIIQYLPV